MNLKALQENAKLVRDIQNLSQEDLNKNHQTTILQLKQDISKLQSKVLDLENKISLLKKGIIKSFTLISSNNKSLQQRMTNEFNSSTIENKPIKNKVVTNENIV